MERQNDMADLNNEKEISLFSSLITGLGYVWQDKEVSEILSRFACQVLGLRDKARILALETGIYMGTRVGCKLGKQVYTCEQW